MTHYYIVSAAYSAALSRKSAVWSHTLLFYHTCPRKLIVSCRYFLNPHPSRPIFSSPGRMLILNFHAGPPACRRELTFPSEICARPGFAQIHNICPVFSDIFVAITKTSKNCYIFREYTPNSPYFRI